MLVRSKGNAKPAERSLKGKGVGGFRGIVRFCEGWMRNEGLLTEVSEKRKGYGRCGDLSVVDILHCNRKKSGTVPYPINLNR